MPIQQMIAEMNAMMAALQLTANIIGIIAVSVFAVYAIGLTALALSEKLRMIRRPSLPKIQLGQMNPSATRTVLQ
ncbi:MAG: hypothetical protein AAB401_07515 [Acidobacteriota bacterium]